jgi:DNA repair protein RadC
MPILDWPQEKRPRERLIREGAQALSEAELLAIFLRTGVAGKDAVQLGQEMMHHFGSLQRLFGATLPEFALVHGLGPAKFAQLQAVMELARRAILEEIKAGVMLSSPRAVKEYLRTAFAGKPFESFHVLFLDVKNRLIDAKEMFRGTLTHTEVQYLRNNFSKKKATKTTPISPRVSELVCVTLLPRNI